MMRLARILLVVLLIVQPVLAQTARPEEKAIRVRVTGVDHYDIPGVITIEANRITGRPVTSSPNIVRFSRTDTGPVISVLKPGRRVTGEARGVEGDLLQVVSDDDQELSLIPTDSIALLERQKSPIVSRETARGIGLGAGVGIFGLSYLAAMQCEPDDAASGPCWRFFQTLMFVGAPVIGVLLGWHLGRVKWERVTIDELRAEFATVGRP